MNTHSLYQNQGWLVINGTKGIAPSIILRAAQRGAQVLFSAPPECQRDAEKIVADAAAAGLSDHVSFVVANLADEQSVEQLADTASERLPSINAVIHNLESESVLENRSLLDISLEEWNGVLTRELRVPFMLARRMVEEFLFSQAPGRIVYIGYAEQGQAPRSAAYATAQSGLRALVRCLTKEFGRREIACNAVMAPARDGKYESPSAELVETVLFFASSESSFVNGEFLHIAGERRDVVPMQLAGSRSDAKG